MCIQRGGKLTGVRVGLAEELRARVQVSERPDAQTVGGVKLRLEELATNLPNVHQLQEAGGRQKNLRGQHEREDKEKPGCRGVGAPSTRHLPSTETQLAHHPN